MKMSRPLRFRSPGEKHSSTSFWLPSNIPRKRVFVWDMWSKRLHISAKVHSLRNGREKSDSLNDLHWPFLPCRGHLSWLWTTKSFKNTYFCLEKPTENMFKLSTKITKTKAKIKNKFKLNRNSKKDESDQNLQTEWFNSVCCSNVCFPHLDVKESFTDFPAMQSKLTCVIQLEECSHIRSISVNLCLLFCMCQSLRGDWPVVCVFVRKTASQMSIIFLWRKAETLQIGCWLSAGDPRE